MSMDWDMNGMNRKAGAYRTIQLCLALFFAYRLSLRNSLSLENTAVSSATELTSTHCDSCACILTTKK